MFCLSVFFFEIYVFRPAYSPVSLFFYSAGCTAGLRLPPLLCGVYARVVPPCLAVHPPGRPRPLFISPIARRRRLVRCLVLGDTDLRSDLGPFRDTPRAHCSQFAPTSARAAGTTTSSYAIPLSSRAGGLRFPYFPHDMVLSTGARRYRPEEWKKIIRKIRFIIAMMGVSKRERKENNYSINGEPLWRDRQKEGSEP